LLGEKPDCLPPPVNLEEIDLSKLAAIEAKYLRASPEVQLVRS
jgi:hypothetical protein